MDNDKGAPAPPPGPSPVDGDPATGDPPPAWFPVPSGDGADVTYRWWDGTGWGAAAQWVDGDWIIVPGRPRSGSAGAPRRRRRRRAVLVGVAVAVVAALLIGWVLVALNDELLDLSTTEAGTIERSCQDDLDELRSAVADFREQNGEYPTEYELVASDWLDEESPYFDVTDDGEIVLEDDSPCDAP